MSTTTKFVWLLLLLPFLSPAQEQLGLRLENYAGVNSLLLNPANNVTSAFKWDINLAEVGVFFDKNYAYIQQTNLIEIANNSENFQLIFDTENIDPSDSTLLVVDFFSDNRSRFTSSLVEVMGPSFMIKLGSGHTFGIYTRARAAVEARGIPNSLSYYTFENVIEGESFSLPKFKVAGMTWTELGFNYAKEFYTDNGIMGLGGSVKILNGYEAFYVNNNTNFEATRFPNDSIGTNRLDLAYGFTRSSVDAETFEPQRNGGGVGFDLGAVWTIEESEDDYKLKLGVSILDLGRINFKRNAESHVLQADGPEGFNTNDFDVVTSVDEGTELLSELLLGEGSLSQNPDNFGIWLPTALSIQADYKIAPMVYANASLVQSIPMPGPALARNNILAISPRIEHRWFALSLPLVWYNWQDFRVGTAVRLAFLTLGSDNLGSLVGRSNFTGSDFYLALKVNPFQFNFGGGGKYAKRGGKNVKCYEF